MKEMTFCRIKVTLNYTKPKIFRDIVVPWDVTLDVLHDVIQIAMGWEDMHLHEWSLQHGRTEVFFVDELPDYEIPNTIQYLEKEFRLCDVLSEECRDILYTYDMGDNWAHTVHISRFDYKKPVPFPFHCLDGYGACPPEDSGGVGGYYEKLRVMADPDDPDHDFINEWMGGSFDPEKFSIRNVNKLLQNSFEIG